MEGVGPRPGPRRWARLIARAIWIALAAMVALFLIVLLLIDPAAGIGLVIGLIAPLAIALAMRSARTRPARGGERSGAKGARAILIFGGALVLAVFAMASLLLRSSNRSAPDVIPPPAPDFTIKEYRLRLTAAGKDAFSMHVRASGTMGTSAIRINEPAEAPSDVLVSQPPIRIRATGRGPLGLLREVTVVAPEDSFLQLILPDGTVASGVLCEFGCVKARVEVAGLSHGAFTEARDALDLSSSRFHGSETVSWSPLDPSDEPAFDYIRPPYHHFRAVLGPVLQAGSLGALILTLIGSLLGIVGLVLLGMGKDRLRALFERILARLTKRKPKKARGRRQRPGPREPRLTPSSGRGR